MSQVYFVHAPAVNLVKIGRSLDPERRFQELSLLSPVPLSVIGVVDGGSGREAELHRRFTHLRSHGEWFHAARELLDFAAEAALHDLWDKLSPEARDRCLAWLRSANRLPPEAA